MTNEAFVSWVAFATPTRNLTWSRQRTLFRDENFELESWCHSGVKPAEPSEVAENRDVNGDRHVLVAPAALPFGKTCVKCTWPCLRICMLHSQIRFSAMTYSLWDTVVLANFAETVINFIVKYHLLMLFSSK